MATCKRGTSYYAPSLRVPVLAFPVAVLGSFVSLPGAWLYAWLGASLPSGKLLLLHALFIVGFALWLGLVVWLTTTVAKVRNPRWMGWLGMFIGTVSWYFHWAVYATYTISPLQTAADAGGGAIIEMASHPLHLLRVVTAPVVTLSGDHFVISSLRFLSWLVELLFLLAASAAAGATRASAPFCETTNTWARTNHLPYLFACTTTPEKAVERLESDPKQIFSLLAKPVDEDVDSYWKVTLYSCAGHGLYVTIRGVKKPTASGHNSGKSVRFLVEAMRLPDIDLEDATRMFAETARHIATPPELLAAVEALETGEYQWALDEAAPHISALRFSLRTDALRLSGLANARLEHWEHSRQCWLSLYTDIPTARNALEIATSSVMAGEVEMGEKWVAKAIELNSSDRTVPGLTILTSYMTALTRVNQMKLAFRYLEQLKECYENLTVTDAHFLWTRGVPFFETFLEKSATIVREVLDAEQGKAWYESMLPHLDDSGREGLNAFLSKWPRENVSLEN